MKYKDLVKKLENLETPEIELSGHRRALRMALLSSRHFRGRAKHVRERPLLDWRRVLAPVTAALLLLAVVLPLAVPEFVSLGGNEIGKFSSYGQLQEFVKTNAGYKQFRWGLLGGSAILAPAGAEDSANVPSVTGHSTTNIQVVGVDEADIVKTDGEYIYFVSGNRTLIVRAYPPEQAQVVSSVEVEGTVIAVFINGNRLVVFAQETPYYGGIWRGSATERIYMPYKSPETSVKVYDVSDRANPLLQREISADGQYISSRMIGDYAYLVINEPVYEQDGGVNLPKISIGDEERKISAEEIWYSNVSDYYYMYTTIIAINAQNDAEEPTYETILLGASSTLYVSMNNIYLTFPVWGGGVGDFQRTSIHRIRIAGDEITPVASGEVPGMVLNQFSMDEHNGYFRVATTVHGEKPINKVYVLNSALDITGSTPDLAPGETIYSARFMGGRCYLVTFRSVDPLFVIDLSDPYNPTVLGELKITGYSSYLHPYDENHIIGIGKETVAERDDFAWYQGLKISLFDVSDVNKPREISKYEIGDRGTDSPVLWDHKAFLFDRSRNLLVIPVLEAKIDPRDYPQSDYPEGIPTWAYGRPIWQGAYVFDISPAGIAQKGRITHVEGSPDPEQGYYYYSPFAVERSLYITGDLGNVLYTISQAKIKMNSLETLAYISEVKLPYETWMPQEVIPGETGSGESSEDGEPGTAEPEK